MEEANTTYEGRMHNLFCDNCHSHVCRALENMEYAGVSHYNMVMLATWCFFRGKLISVGRTAYTVSYHSQVTIHRSIA